jgi:hypothetical protein
VLGYARIANDFVIPAIVKASNSELAPLSNIEKSNNVIITLGSRQVERLHSPGTGFQIKGTATFLKYGDNFNTIKQRFSWARAAVEVKVNSVIQTLQ